MHTAFSTEYRKWIQFSSGFTSLSKSKAGYIFLCCESNLDLKFLACIKKEIRLTTLLQ